MASLVTPDPPPGLSPELAPIYEEARAVADASPASASALLRVLLRSILAKRGGAGRHLGHDLSSVAEMGSSPTLLRAWDAIGMTDSVARRPAELNLADGHSDAQNLFMFVNLLVSQLDPR